MARNKPKRKSEFCTILVDVDAAVEEVDAVVQELTERKFGLSPAYKAGELPYLIAQYGEEEVVAALRAGFEGYRGNIARTIEKLEGILFCRAQPAVRRRGEIQKTLACSFDGYVSEEGEALLRLGWLTGGGGFLSAAEDLIDSFSGRFGWPQVRRHLVRLLMEGLDD